MACRCSISHNFTLPSLSYDWPQPHLHTLHTHFTGNLPTAYTENKLNNAPHVPIIENHFTHLQCSSHSWSKRLQTHCIYNSSHACKETHLCLFWHLTGVYFTDILKSHITAVSLTAILIRCTTSIWNYKSYLFINNST